MKYVYILVWADTNQPQWTPTISAVYGSQKRASAEADIMNKISREKKYSTHYYIKKEAVH